MHRNARLAAAAASVALTTFALVGCVQSAVVPNYGSSEEPTAPDTVQAGDCLSGQVPNANGNFDADLTSVVDCGETSHYLVYAVLEIGEEFLPAEGASEADVVAQRDNITLNSGAAYADFRFAVRNACSQEFISQTGLGSVDIMGASAADVIAEPSGNFYTDVTVSTEAEWIAGDYYFACSLGWEDYDKSPMTAVLGSGVTIADFFTPKWPMELRRCTQWVGTDGSENVIASCDEAHWMEHSVLIDPWAVLGEDARPTTIDEEKLMELDAYCSAFTDSFIGDGAPPDAYKSISVWFNWGEDQLPTNMVCGVSVINSDTLDVVGSLAGIGAGSPQTVEVPAA